eukprot:6191717-Pleurochrysis_carterae.AAC.7
MREREKDRENEGKRMREREEDCTQENSARENGRAQKGFRREAGKRTKKRNGWENARRGTEEENEEITGLKGPRREPSGGSSRASLASRG